MCSVVENTFTSIPHMARHLISYVKYIPLICHKNRVSAIDVRCFRVSNHVPFNSSPQSTKFKTFLLQFSSFPVSTILSCHHRWWLRCTVDAKVPGSNCSSYREAGTWTRGMLTGESLIGRIMNLYFCGKMIAMEKFYSRLLRGDNYICSCSPELLSKQLLIAIVWTVVKKSLFLLNQICRFDRMIIYFHQKLFWRAWAKSTRASLEFMGGVTAVTLANDLIDVYRVKIAEWREGKVSALPFSR